MKKFFCILTILLLTVGCTKPRPNFDMDFSINTYNCDMSGYKGLTSANHVFKGVTVKDVEKTIKEKGYGAFVLSRKGCDHCQIVMKYINEAAKELDINVYYIDGESDVYPIVGTEDYELLDNLLKPIEEMLDGDYTLQTPHFFTIVNGEFVDSYIGVKFKDDLNPTDKEIENLINKYKKALEIFVQ